MPLVDTVLGNISRVSNTASQGLNSLSSIFSSETGSARGIRNTYLNGFFNEGNSQYTPNVFSRLFDEPTYLSFRIEFNFDNNYYNSVNYVDYLPEPFLNLDAKNPNSPFVSPSEYYKNSDYNQSSDWTNSLQIVNANFANSRIGNGIEYSTYDYLRNALGESRRADMLYLFVNSLKDIQEHFPYYFQSINGLGSLLKVNAKDGIRLKDGENRITIKCLEGLDLKITQLLQLYKNVVWDEVYQRWMLPDMMRYFNMKIYVSEIRLFHTSNKSISDPNSGWMYNFKSGNHSLNASSYDQLSSSSLLENLNNVLNTASAISSQVSGTNSTITNILNTGNHIVDTAGDITNDISGLMYHLCNNAINDVMPTICIDCHMCEFDIENTLGHIDSLSASTKGNSSPEPEIAIKVGKVFTKQIYPLNRDLSSTQNEYVVTLSDDFMAGAYIDETTLSKRNASSADPYLGLNNDNSNVITETRISSGLNRLGFDTNRSNNSDLTYNPGRGSEDIAAIGLTTGILNNVLDGVKSAATENTNRDILNIRNNIVVDANISGESLATADENKIYANVDVKVDSNSEATNVSSEEKQNIRTDTQTNVSFGPAGTIRSMATFPQLKRAGKRVLPADAIFDNIFDRYSATQINDAINYLKIIRSTATNSKAIPVFSNDDLNDEIKHNILAELLERVKASKATNGENALTELIDIILDESRSKATDKDNKINGFDALN